MVEQNSNLYSSKGSTITDDQKWWRPEREIKTSRRAIIIEQEPKKGYKSQRDNTVFTQQSGSTNIY